MAGFRRAMGIVIFTTVVAGSAEYPNLNILAHPDLQPLLTVFITAVAALTNGLAVRYYWDKRPRN
jgi:hypothetical protein